MTNPYWRLGIAGYARKLESDALGGINLFFAPITPLSLIEPWSDLATGNHDISDRSPGANSPEIEAMINDIQAALLSKSPGADRDALRADIVHALHLKLLASSSAFSSADHLIKLRVPIEMLALDGLTGVPVEIPLMQDSTQSTIHIDEYTAYDQLEGGDAEPAQLYVYMPLVGGGDAPVRVFNVLGLKEAKSLTNPPTSNTQVQFGYDSDQGYVTYSEQNAAPSELTEQQGQLFPESNLLGSGFHRKFVSKGGGVLMMKTRMIPVNSDARSPSLTLEPDWDLTATVGITDLLFATANYVIDAKMSLKRYDLDSDAYVEDTSGWLTLRTVGARGSQGMQIVANGTPPEPNYNGLTVPYLLTISSTVGQSFASKTMNFSVSPATPEFVRFSSIRFADAEEWHDTNKGRSYQNRSRNIVSGLSDKAEFTLEFNHPVHNVVVDMSKISVENMSATISSAAAVNTLSIVVHVDSASAGYEGDVNMVLEAGWLSGTTGDLPSSIQWTRVRRGNKLTGNKLTQRIVNGAAKGFQMQQGFKLVDAADSTEYIEGTGVTHAQHVAGLPPLEKRKHVLQQIRLAQSFQQQDDVAHFSAQDLGSDSGLYDDANLGKRIALRSGEGLRVDSRAKARWRRSDRPSGAKERFYAPLAEVGDEVEIGEDADKIVSFQRAADKSGGEKQFHLVYADAAKVNKVLFAAERRLYFHTLNCPHFFDIHDKDADGPLLKTIDGGVAQVQYVNLRQGQKVYIKVRANVEAFDENLNVFWGLSEMAEPGQYTFVAKSPYFDPAAVVAAIGGNAQAVEIQYIAAAPVVQLTEQIFTYTMASGLTVGVNDTDDKYKRLCAVEEGDVFFVETQAGIVTSFVAGSLQEGEEYDIQQSSIEQIPAGTLWYNAAESEVHPDPEVVGTAKAWVTGQDYPTEQHIYVTILNAESGIEEIKSEIDLNVASSELNAVVFEVKQGDRINFRDTWTDGFGPGSMVYLQFKPVGGNQFLDVTPQQFSSATLSAWGVEAENDWGYPQSGNVRVPGDMFGDFIYAHIPTPFAKIAVLDSQGIVQRYMVPSSQFADATASPPLVYDATDASLFAGDLVVDINQAQTHVVYTQVLSGSLGSVSDANREFGGIDSDAPTFSAVSAFRPNPTGHFRVKVLGNNYPGEIQSFVSVISHDGYEIDVKEFVHPQIAVDTQVVPKDTPEWSVFPVFEGDRVNFRDTWGDGFGPDSMVHVEFLAPGSSTWVPVDPTSDPSLPFTMTAFDHFVDALGATQTFAENAWGFPRSGLMAPGGGFHANATLNPDPSKQTPITKPENVDLFGDIVVGAPSSPSLAMVAGTRVASGIDLEFQVSDGAGSGVVDWINTNEPNIRYKSVKYKALAADAQFTDSKPAVFEVIRFEGIYYESGPDLFEGAAEFKLQAVDAVGNVSEEQSFAWEFDRTGPTGMSLVNESAEEYTIAPYTNNPTATFRLTVPAHDNFNMTLGEIISNALDIQNGTATAISSTAGGAGGTIYHFSVQASDYGTVTVKLLSHEVKDTLGNGSTDPVIEQNFLFDNVLPYVTGTDIRELKTGGNTLSNGSYTNTELLIIYFDISEAFVAFEPADFDSNHGDYLELQNCTYEPNSFGQNQNTDPKYIKIEVRCTAEGPVQVQLKANAIVDLAGNQMANPATVNVIYDITSPTASFAAFSDEAMTQPILNGTLSSHSRLYVRAEFSEEPVFAGPPIIEDFFVADNCVITNVVQLPNELNKVYTMQVDAVTPGVESTVQLVAGMWVDSAGNANLGVASGSGEFAFTQAVQISGDPYVFPGGGGARMKLPDACGVYRLLETRDFVVNGCVGQMTDEEKSACLDIDPESETEGYFFDTYKLISASDPRLNFLFTRSGKLSGMLDAFDLRIDPRLAVDNCAHQGQSLYKEARAYFPSGSVGFRLHNHPQILSSLDFRPTSADTQYGGLAHGKLGVPSAYLVNSLDDTHPVQEKAPAMRPHAPAPPVVEYWRDVGSTEAVRNDF